MAQVFSALEGAEEISIAAFNKFIGPIYRLADCEKATRFAFPVIEKHLNAGGTVHGGMLMAFLDISMSRTARLSSGAPSCSTVSLNCDFLAPGKLGDVVESRVWVTRQTRTIAFLSAEGRAGESLLLTAQGVWRLAVAR